MYTPTEDQTLAYVPNGKVIAEEWWYVSVKLVEVGGSSKSVTFFFDDVSSSATETLTASFLMDRNEHEGCLGI
jgi:hypothetical protein